MKFKVGDIVTVVTLHREGTVLEILGNGMYRVTLGNLPLVVAENHLAQSSTARPKKPKGGVKEYRLERTETLGYGHEKEEIDLHGMTVNEALAAVDDKINRAIMSNLHRIKLVHGVGSGRLKHAIHEHLSQTKVVAAFKLDEFNPGVTWVYL